MNIILERWKGYITENEESYAKYNTNLMLRGPSTLNISNVGSVALLLRIARPLTVEEMFKKIPQLRNHKIKKVLGTGTKGIALELDNGRALKLYKQGYLGTEESFYDAEAGKIFSGRGEISTLPVFDRGTVVASGDSNEDIEYLDYLEVLMEDARLTLSETNGLLTMITYILVNYSSDYLQDLHAGNFGVVSQTVGRPNPYFVIFDP